MRFNVKMMTNSVATKIWSYLGEAFLCIIVYLLLVMLLGDDRVASFVSEHYLWIAAGFLALVALQSNWWRSQRDAMRGGFREWLIAEQAYNYYKVAFNTPIIVSLITVPVVIVAGVSGSFFLVHSSAILCAYGAVNTFTMFRNLDAFRELHEEWRGDDSDRGM